MGKRSWGVLVVVPFFPAVTYQKSQGKHKGSVEELRDREIRLESAIQTMAAPRAQHSLHPDGNRGTQIHGFPLANHLSLGLGPGL